MKNICCTIPRLVEALFFIYYFGFPFFIFSIDDQSCSAATVNGLSGKTKTKASAASTAASVPRKLDQPQDLTVPDIVTWLPVLLTASSTSTQGKLLKSVDNCSVAALSVVQGTCVSFIPFFVFCFWSVLVTKL